MQESKYHSPPRLAKRFLHWFCKSELLEDISGDLEEDFNDFIEECGLKKAKRKYWMAVIRFLKPFAIKKMSVTITQTVMFKNYFKTSVRSIVRNKLFSTINIVGLAISMSVCLLMISFMSELYSYDKFHNNADRIYRIVSEQQFLENDPELVAAVPILVGKRLQNEVPGIEASVIMNRRFRGDANFEDKTVSLNGLWASKDFFKVFSAIPLLQGNAETALANPNSIVLTEEAAIKIFGENNALGKTIKMRSVKLTVTGIVEKPPFNSHFTFEALGSMITYENILKQTAADRWLRWTNVGNDFVYLLMDENTKPSSVQTSLDKINQEENAKNERFKVNAKLQPILSIMPGPQMSNNIGKSMDSSILRILLILTVIVILSAGFNYTNLSVARSLRRAKEIGVRKVVGANRTQIFSQFIIEAVLVSLVALIFAVLLFYLIKPHFLNVDPLIQQTTKLISTPSLFIYFIVFSTAVGIMAGFFPAIYLSKLKAVSALKNAPTNRLFRRVNMRKVLIVVQFSLSLLFIISATISYKQYKYAVDFDLGYQTENVLNVRLQGNNSEKVLAAFEAIPTVTQVSRSFDLNGIGNGDRTRVKHEDPQDSAFLFYNFIDENFIPLMKHELLAGTNFDSRPAQKSEESIIVNESTIKRFNMGSPQEAIDQHIQLIGGSKLRIRGVVKDFVYTDISREVQLFGFRYNPRQYSFVNIKLNTNNLLGTMAQLRMAWKKVDDSHELQAEFYDEQIQATYAQFSVIYIMVGFLAFITISIAALGLLGMAVYTAETRIKEISIRKIMGATEGSLIKLLTKGFMWLLVVSAVIAVPISYYIFDSIILSDSVNRTSIGMVELLSGVLLIFFIGFLTIGSQTWKAAKSNPAETLRSE